MNTVTSAIEETGLTKLARNLGFFPSAVQKWRDDGRLPKSDLAGLTNYANVIEQMTAGKYPASKLLSDTRESWLVHAKKNPGRKSKGKIKTAKRKLYS